MVISICAATDLELAPLRQRLQHAPLASHRVQFFTTGVGMLQSCFHIQQHLLEVKPELIIQLGIAGCFDKAIPLGSTVIIEKEYLGTLGVLENSPEQAGWQDIFDLGLENPDLAPFKTKALINTYLSTWPWLEKLGLPAVSSVTVDEITTSPHRIQTLQSLYQPKVESMEGASLHYCALKYQLSFIQIRGISNYIGERNKAYWKIGPALQGATNSTLSFLAQL